MLPRRAKARFGEVDPAGRKNVRQRKKEDRFHASGNGSRSLPPLATTLLTGAASIVVGLLRRKPSAHGIEDHREPFDLDHDLAGIRLPAPSRVPRKAVLAVLAVVLLAGACIVGGYRFKFAQEARERAVALTAGNPDIGRRLIQRYGCAGCHTIPGIAGADGKVGPSLQGLAGRVYVGGVAANDPDNLVQWIENPRSIDPKTAMPATGISRAEARHVAAYLYMLR